MRETSRVSCFLESTFSQEFENDMEVGQVMEVVNILAVASLNEVVEDSIWTLDSTEFLLQIAFISF